MIVEEQSIAYTNVVSREYFFTILIWKSNRRFIDRNCASEFNGQSPMFYALKMYHQMEICLLNYLCQYMRVVFLNQKQ